MNYGSVGLLSVVVALALNVHTAAAGVAIGEAAPDFTLTDIHGEKHSLSDYQGKYVVLEWINYGCPFVKKHYVNEHMPNLQKEYAEKDVVWLSICSSAPGKQGFYTAEEAIEVNKAQKNAAAAYLLDTDGAVGRQYGAKVTPHMYIINPEGNLIYQGAIDDIPSTSADDVAKANNYVRAALDAAMSGKEVGRASTTPYGCSVKYN
jgi:alkyl hydroperoxide reductase subunit AhpC